MIVAIDRRFQKDVDHLQNKKMNSSIVEIIKHIQSSNSVSEIKNFKKIKGFKNFYRIRLGDYRIGLEYSDNQITLIRFLHRKNIYNQWP